MKSRFVFAFLMPLLTGCNTLDPCENVVSQTITSPDSKRKVVVFTRGCGATTSDSTQVSLLDAKTKLGDEAGNVFVIGDAGNVSIRWKNGRTVEIEFSSTAETFAKESVVNGVHFQYKPR